MKYGSGRRQRVRVQSLTSATPRFPPNRISNGVMREDLDYRFSESKACQARSGAVTWKSQKSCSRSTATPQCRPPRPLARTPALSRDAEAGAPPALPDDRGRSQIGTQGPEKVESGSLGLPSTGEAESGLPARPAEAFDLARDRLGARPEIPPQPVDRSRIRARVRVLAGAKRGGARSARPRREPLDGDGCVGRRGGRGRRVARRSCNGRSRASRKKTPRPACGERAGVRGGAIGRGTPQPLILTFSPQAGRRDAGRVHAIAMGSHLVENARVLRKARPFSPRAARLAPVSAAARRRSCRADSCSWRPAGRSQKP